MIKEERKNNTYKYINTQKHIHTQAKTSYTLVTPEVLSIKWGNSSVYIECSHR